MMVSIQPNLAHIEAYIQKYTPTTDSYGGYAELAIKKITTLPNHQNFLQGLEGKIITAFVPPQLTNHISTSQTYTGSIKCTGQNMYLLIPEK